MKIIFTLSKKLICSCFLIFSFQIIDDDIGLNSLIPTQEQDILVDLLDPEGPAIADDDVLLMDEKPKVVNKVDLFTNNTWIQVDVCETDEGDLVVGESQSSKSLFKKRGGIRKILIFTYLYKYI